MKLQVLMKVIGLSQEDMSKLTGVSAPTFVRINRGDIMTRNKNMKKIADALGVAIPEIDEFAEVIRRAQSGEIKKPRLSETVPG